MEKKSLTFTKTTTIEEAETWIVDNRYLCTGYRRSSISFTQVVSSLFSRHNELLNIWTHFIGAILFIALLFFVFNNVSQAQVIKDEIKLKLQKSDFFHAISKHSSSVSKFFDSHKINLNMTSLQNYLENKKKEYQNKYQQLSEQVISKEKKLVAIFNKKLDKILHKIEDAFEQVTFKVQSLSHKSSLDFDKLNDKIDEILHINPLMHFIDEVLNSELEFYPVVVYMACAIICLSLSAIFHSFYIMNPTICKILQKCDYAGIVILIFGSSYAFYFYNFYCYSFWQNFYSICLLVISIIVFFSSLSDYCDREEGKTFLGLIMAGLGLFNVLPAIHSILLAISPQHSKKVIPYQELALIILTGAFYLGGLVFKVKQFPERFYPKKFDIWMNSHTIWHIFVVLGAISHYFMVVHVFHVRSEMTCR